MFRIAEGVSLLINGRVLHLCSSAASLAYARRKRGVRLWRSSSVAFYIWLWRLGRADAPIAAAVLLGGADVRRHRSVCNCAVSLHFVVSDREACQREPWEPWMLAAETFPSRYFHASG
jgi:hypothetical protein